MRDQGLSLQPTQAEAILADLHPNPQLLDYTIKSDQHSSLSLRSKIYGKKDLWHQAEF